MFDIWLRSDPNASWEVLIDALHKMKYRCLAQSVEQTYVNVCKAQNKQGMPTSECMASFYYIENLHCIPLYAYSLMQQQQGFPLNLGES